MIKAVIFDLDGVLVDSEPFSEEASNRALAEHGIRITAEERKRAFGRRDMDSYRDYIRARGLDLDPGEINRRKVEIYSGLIKGKLKPIPGARELVERLRKRGMPFALASSGTPGKIRATLTEIGFGRLFSVIITAEDISRGKPDPEIFLGAAEKLRVRPADCLVVEDSQAGVEAAKKANMKCIALRSKNTFGQDLSEADKIVNSLEEIKLDKGPL